VIEAQKASVYRSLVAGPLVEDGYSVLLACIFRERGLVAVVAYVRRARDFNGAEVDGVREALPSLDAAIERHAAGHAAEAAEQRVVPTVCVLGPDLAVDDVSSSALQRERLSAGGRLPAEIEGRVRAAIADWGSDIENCPAKVAATEDGRHVLRIFPLQGRNGLRIAVLWEPMRREAALLRSVERYGLTLREVQILNLLAGGSSSAEIAAGLGIAESTVNEHVVRMMQKTEATNRVELIATTMVNTER
jgi:DNA-binding CsgD family transcriptional regulator